MHLTTIQWATTSLCVFIYIAIIACIVGYFCRKHCDDWKEIRNTSRQVQDGGRGVYRNPGKDRT